MPDGPRFEPHLPRGVFTVTKRGEPDRPGACYAVLDYGQDEAARVAARSYVNGARAGNAARAEELAASLDGRPEGATLRMYEVQRQDGADDSAARYLVLDYIHDYSARVALRIYHNIIRAQRPMEAAELRAELAATQEAYRLHIESLNPAPKKKARRSTTRRRRSA